MPYCFVFQELMTTCTQLSCEKHPQQLRGNLSIEDFALYRLSFAPFKQVPKILEPTLESELIHFTTPFFFAAIFIPASSSQNRKKNQIK